VAVLIAVRAKAAILKQKRASVPDTVPDINEWINARFADEILFLEEVAYDLEVTIATMSQPAKARASLSAMDTAKVHPLAVEEELTDLLKVLGSEPSKTQSAGKKVSEAWSSLTSRIPAGRSKPS
jgi:hypothetical protein